MEIRNWILYVSLPHYHLHHLHPRLRRVYVSCPLSPPPIHPLFASHAARLHGDVFNMLLRVVAGGPFATHFTPPFFMITFHPNEQETLVIRKHWLVLVAHLSFIVLLMGILSIALLGSSVVGSIFANSEEVGKTLSFSLVLFAMMLLAAFFFVLMDYYLDMWIVTNERIIDVEQHGFFSRRISEIPLARVQDVTLEVHGVLHTLFNYGTIRIQTAGETSFDMKDVPHLAEIKDAILKHQRSVVQEISNPNGV